jgi:hypothetical protein
MTTMPAPPLLCVSLSHPLPPPRHNPQANDAFCMTLGYTPEELSAVTIYMLTAQESLSHVMKALCEILSAQKSSTSICNINLVRKNGQKILFDLEISAQGYEILQSIPPRGRKIYHPFLRRFHSIPIPE